MAVGTNTRYVFRRHEERRQLVQLSIVAHKAVKCHATEIRIGQANVESVVASARIALEVTRIAVVELGVDERLQRQFTAQLETVCLRHVFGHHGIRIIHGIVVIGVHSCRTIWSPPRRSDRRTAWAVNTRR